MINTYAGEQQDLENRYRALSDDGLLQLSIEGGLTREAETARQAEMRKRSLGAKEIKDLKEWEEQQKPSLPPPQRIFFGYGMRFVGHKYLSTENERQGIFVATKFIVLKYGSILPIGSYRVTQTNGEFPQIENRVAMQWDQVWWGVKLPLLSMTVGLGLAAVMIYLKERK